MVDSLFESIREFLATAIKAELLLRAGWFESDQNVISNYLERQAGGIHCLFYSKQLSTSFLRLPYVYPTMSTRIISDPPVKLRLEKMRLESHWMKPKVIWIVKVELSFPTRLRYTFLCKSSNEADYFRINTELCPKPE